MNLPWNTIKITYLAVNEETMPGRLQEDVESRSPQDAQNCSARVSARKWSGPVIQTCEINTQMRRKRCWDKFTDMTGSWIWGHGASGLRLGLWYFLLYAIMDFKMDFNNGLAKGKLIMFTRIQFVFELCGCADIDTNDTIRDSHRYLKAFFRLNI